MPSPPGPQRSYPPPTTTGKIAFTPSGHSDLKCETYYFLWGDLESSKHPPLICLHGGPGSPGRAQKYFALLWVDYGIPVILYDQIGCGESTHLREKKGDLSFWTFELFFGELLNLVSALKITSYDLLGHSWGAILAGKFALTQPQGLRKLVISSGPASTALRVEFTKRQKQAMPAEVREVLERCEREGTIDSAEYKQAMGQFSKRHLCRTDPPPPELSEMMAEMARDNTVYSTLYGESPLQMTGPLKDFDIIPDLPQITTQTVPGGVLVMNGKYDTSQDPVMAPWFWKVGAKAKWVTFAESGHMTIIDETEKSVEVVGSFLYT